MPAILDGYLDLWADAVAQLIACLTLDSNLNTRLMHMPIFPVRKKWRHEDQKRSYPSLFQDQPELKEWDPPQTEKKVQRNQQQQQQKKNLWVVMDFRFHLFSHTF